MINVKGLKKVKGVTLKYTPNPEENEN